MSAKVAAIPGGAKGIGKDIALESEIAQDGGESFCMGLTREVASRMDIEQARIMKRQLRALHAMLAGDNAGAEIWLKKAVSLEDSISYDYGPPTIQKPTHEMYGEWLLEQRRPAEALQQFEIALARAPGRVLALRGLNNAKEALAGKDGPIAEK